MTDAEFRDWLEAEVAGGRMTRGQRDDLLDQKRHFDMHRGEIERLFQLQVVGYVGGSREVDATVQELLARLKRSHPGRMVYFEPVGSGPSLHPPRCCR
jgi:hypothetical protein